MSNWINIYKTDRIFDAETVSLNLKQNGIVNTILNQRDSAYGSFGNIFVRIPEEFSAQALAIINNLNIYEN
jgi:hypothetical protein